MAATVVWRVGAVDGKGIGGDSQHVERALRHFCGGNASGGAASGGSPLGGTSNGHNHPRKQW